MCIQKIGVNTHSKSSYNCSDSTKSHIGKLSGFAVGITAGTGLVYSQMGLLKTISGKKNLLENFYLGIENPEEAPKRIISRNKDGKILLPKDGINERSKVIVKSHKRYYIKWGAFITLLTTCLGCLADKSITAVNKKETARINYKS